MKEVHWGPEFKMDYTNNLRKKWLVACLLLGVLIGELVGIGLMFVLSLRIFSLTVFWVVICQLTLIVGLWALIRINRRLCSVENYLEFYPDRYEVRHQIYCTNRFHCLGLHYFKRFNPHV